MPEEVEETVQSILDDNPDMDESEAYAIAYDQYEGDTAKRAALAKAAPNAEVSKTEFEVTTEGSVGAICKADDDYVIWGPASVEVVDKENDRITAKALEDALPQLLKRKRLSYEHSDQIVGDILERFTTEEPVEVEINGRSFERSEFPTGVLELDGMKPGLYVAGNIYNDTQKAKDVREEIEAGEVDSYSISGEAITTEMAMKDGQTFTDILKLDLSAVTLCKEGMNQEAKFDVVSTTEPGDRRLTPQRAAKLAKTRLNKTMSDQEDDNDDVEKFVDALDNTLDDRLPEGELATKSDVEEMVEEKIDEKAQEGSPTEGSPEQPSGDDSSGGVEQDPEYEGDSDEWGESAVDDSDKVEEKADAYTTEELKSILPDDQFKAIAPLLQEKEEGLPESEPDAVPEEVPPKEPEEEEEVPEREPEMPDEEGMEDPVLAAEKSLGVDWDRLSEGQKAALMKSGALEKQDSGVQTGLGVGGDADPAHAGTSEGSDTVAKADNDSVSMDPAMRNVYGDDGTPQL